MKWQVLTVDVVLLGILGVYGWSLLGRTSRSGIYRERAAAEANLRLRFADARGIGARGERIESRLLPGTRRVVAFLLRNVSLAEDLGFWRKVAAHLPTSSGVSLVGYCEGSICEEAIRNGPHVREFPVVVYGEVVDSQAVFSADMQGAFVVNDKTGSNEPNSIPWRGEKVEDIVRRLSR